MKCITNEKLFADLLNFHNSCLLYVFLSLHEFSTWWVSFFLLVSALNISKLITQQAIPILDILAWLVNALLLSFSWINSLLRVGYSKPLVLEDIPDLFSEDEANVAYQKFIQAWDTLKAKKDQTNRGNLVLKALTKVYLKESIYVGIGALTRTIATVISPLLIYAFVNYSKQEKENLHEGLILVLCMIVVKAVESISQRHWFFYARRTGMRIRSALMVAVYQKQLRLSSLGRMRHSTGEVVNYIAVDAYRMGEFPWWFHSGWNFVLQLFLSIGVLFGIVGSGALPGLVPLLICGLLNVPFAKLLGDADIHNQE